MTEVERELLEYAAVAGGHFHRRYSLVLEFDDGLEPADLLLLRSDLLVDRCGQHLQLVAVGCQPTIELTLLVARLGELDRARESFLVERFHHRVVPRGIGRIRFDRGEGCLHGEALGFDLGLTVEQCGLRGCQLLLSREGFELYVRVAEHDDHSRRGDDGAGLERALLHASRGERGDETDVFGLEGAGCAHLAEHGAPSDAVDPEGAPINSGWPALEATDVDGDKAQGEHAEGDK